MTTDTNPAESMSAQILGSLQWRLIGPHRGGRVVAVSGDVSDPRTYYFGACAGGVWKSGDGGTTWRNISDGFFTTAAIGAIAVSPSDPNVLYAGTGETCIRGNVSHGDGVYRSTDRGQTWTNMGLCDTRHIGTIRIHPHDPELVYVAALGHAFERNEERGVFRSRDGGEHWEKVLFVSDRAGSHDLAMDPNNPRILYAAIWEAQRSPHALQSGGPDSGLWKSTDGGDTWTELTHRTGLPGGVLGKIGVAVSPAQENRVWAVIEAEDGGLFRSDDGGEVWEKINDGAFLRTRAFYYMHIFADPQDPDTVWVLNYNTWKSVDGGKTFEVVASPHGDEHDLWINPSNTQIMIKGNDGGASVTYNGGASWSSIHNQPTAQMYHVTTDDQFPYRVYGSQQDNTAISIPSRTVDGAIHERDWYAPGGGESGYIAIKPDDPNIVVASGPAGRRAFNDIMTFYDHRTKQRRNITVWPELYGWGVGAESLKYRFQWTFPIMYSQHDPNAFYVAGNYVFRSRDGGGHFEQISGDLTRNDPSKLRPSGGVTRDNTGAEVYCTIFALAESPVQAGLLWAGSDDGLVHISRNGGTDWENVTPPQLPEWALISIIEPSPHQAGTAYLAATRYKLGDTHPYLFKTDDYGKSWSRITHGIPDDDFTRVIREDPDRQGLLYAGTETRLYVSYDDGANWHLMGGNLPVVPMYDLTIKDGSLIVATHGRSFWILDDLNPLREVAAGQVDTPIHLFGPQPAVRLRTDKFAYRPPKPGFASYGHAGTSLVTYDAVRTPEGTLIPRLLDAGENPSGGVSVEYYLQQDPSGPVTLRFLNSDGQELRTFVSGEDAGKDENSSPSAQTGSNRFLWNMRLPGATRIENEDDLVPWQRVEGPLVLPGRYQVRLEVDGQTSVRSFEILPDPRIQTDAQDLQQQFETLCQIRDRLSETNGLVNDIERLRKQLADWQTRVKSDERGQKVATLACELEADVRALESELIDVNMKEPQLYPSGLHEKFNALFDAVDSADYPPTQQGCEVFEQLSKQLTDISDQLRGPIAERVAALNGEIAAAGYSAVGLSAQVPAHT